MGRVRFAPNCGGPGAGCGRGFGCSGGILDGGVARGAAGTRPGLAQAADPPQSGVWRRPFGRTSRRPLVQGRCHRAGFKRLCRRVGQGALGFSPWVRGQGPQNRFSARQPAWTGGGHVTVPPVPTGQIVRQQRGSMACHSACAGVSRGPDAGPTLQPRRYCAGCAVPKATSAPCNRRCSRARNSSGRLLVAAWARSVSWACRATPDRNPDR